MAAPRPVHGQAEIVDVRPDRGSTGDVIRIYGSGFDSTPGNNTVEIGGVAATVTDGSTSYLNVEVPAGVSGPATVRVDANDGNGFQSAAKRFTAVTNGTGTFASTTTLDPTSNGEAASGDVDGDGDLDLLVTGEDDSGNATTTLYLNDGDGSFTKESTNLTTVKDGTVDLADFDNDGDLDVLLTGFDGSSPITSLWTNDGGNPPSFSEQTFIGPTTDVVNSAADVGDMDGDGDLDIVVSGTNKSGNPATTVLTNDLVGGSLGFTVASLSLTDVTNGSMNLGDVNGDGELDVVLTGDSGGGTPVTEVYTNDGGGTSFSVSSLSPAVLRSASALGDVDNDGDLDLVVSGDDGTSQAAELLVNDGNGSFSNAQTLTGIENGTVDLAHANGDGNLDLLLTGDSGGDFPETARFYEGDGTATSPFTETSAGLTAIKNSWTAVGDFSGDGALELFIAGTAGGTRTATLYQSSLSLASSSPAANATSASATGSIDLTFNAPVADLTGLADSIVVRGAQTGDVDGTVSGTGTTTLTYDPAQDFAPGEPVTVSVLEGVASQGGVSLDTTYTFSYTVGASSGPAAFPLAKDVSTDEDGARAVATGDLDGDGDRDLVVGSDVSGFGVLFYIQH